jgi:hypothetical protein
MELRPLPRYGAEEDDDSMSASAADILFLQLQ